MDMEDPSDVEIDFVADSITGIDLPEEIWGLIFEKLTQTEILPLRAVCRKWKKEIDDHYTGWSIDLKDESPFLEHILQLRIKDCKIIRFVNPPPPPLGPDKAFKYPELVKNLQIMEEMGRYEDLISPPNLYTILRTCSKTLEELILSLTSSLLNSPFGPDSGFNFQNLNNLAIVIQKDAPDYLDGTLKVLERNMFHILIGKSTMPKLKSICVKQNVELSNASTARLSYDMLSFIAKHGNVLEDIVYNNHFITDESGLIEGDEFSDLETKLQNSDLPLLKKANGLETVCVSLHGEKVPSVKNAWKELLLSQTKLKMILANNLPLNSLHLKSIVGSNYQTLEFIEIDCFGVQDQILFDGSLMRMFNMAVFQNCINLKHLALCNIETTIPPNEDIPNWHLPGLLNLSQLPAQLGLLDLTEFMIRSDDVLEFIRNHSSSLTSFTCKRCLEEDIGPNSGISGSVMEEIINGQNKLKYVCIDGFNSVNQDEVLKLKRVLEGIGVPEVNFPNYTQVALIRELDSPGTWKVEDLDDDYL